MRRIFLVVCFFFVCGIPAYATTISTADTTKLTQWTFYNEALITEDNDSLTHEPVTIPHRWGNLFGGKNGYGTYITTVQFDESLIGELYAIHIPYAATSYKLLFNGVEQIQLGKVATHAARYEPKQHVVTHYFTITAPEMTIALQVANFSNMVGGAERSISIGPHEIVTHQYQAYTNKENFILGSFLFMVLNVFSLYYFRREDKTYLWVGFIGTLLILWYVFSKDHLVMDAFPSLSWEWMTKLEVLIIFLAFSCYNKYIAYAYVGYYDPNIPKYSFMSFVFYALLTLVLPTSIVITMFNISSVLILLFALHVMYMSYCMIRDERPYAVAIVLTNMAFLVPFIQDMFYIQGFINTNYYSIYGFMFFAVGYLVTLNHQHTKKYKESEMYNLALQEINHGLEEKVDERTRELREKNHQLELLTVRDGLTNIANRRYFDQQLATALRNVKLNQEKCSLILFDIDFFKKYNDHYGHIGGDEVLKNVARITTTCVGDDGIVARYGGEEFAVILPKRALKDAYILAQFIRESIANEQIEHVQSEQYGVVTVSVGVAEAHAAIDAKQFIAMADEALYMSKNNGRNTVSSSGFRDQSARL